MGEVQKALGLTLDEILTLTKSVLKETSYTKDEVISELETTSNQLEEVSLTPNTKNIQKFKLYQRALHVFNGCSYTVSSRNIFLIQ